MLTTADFALYDPSNFTIVSCSQADCDLAIRIMRTGRFDRLGNFCTSYQGEVNETVEKGKGNLSKESTEGPLVLRGSNICLYLLREASQGEDFFLREAAFFSGKSPTSKAFHSKENRVGFQRSSPQENFGRIIAAPIESNQYCFDTISYVPESKSELQLFFLIALLNSKLLDWYFRLGSTNSKVNEYQFKNLPCPIFKEAIGSSDRRLLSPALESLRSGEVDQTFRSIEPALQDAPFSPAINLIIIEAAERISEIEKGRGTIQRKERSALDPSAQPFQDLIDRLFFRMAGLSDREIVDLELRLSEMI